jgi:hypothetical protein
MIKDIKILESLGYSDPKFIGVGAKRVYKVKSTSISGLIIPSQQFRREEYEISLEKVNNLIICNEIYGDINCGIYEWG